jgi:hypothetical protein
VIFSQGDLPIYLKSGKHGSENRLARVGFPVPTVEGEGLGWRSANGSGSDRANGGKPDSLDKAYYGGQTTVRLYKIWVEIEQKFFGGDAVRFSRPTSTQAERL